MTLPRLYAFIAAWRDIPPLHETLAAIAVWAGAIKPRSKIADPNSPEAQNAIGQMLNRAQIKVKQRPA